MAGVNIDFANRLPMEINISLDNMPCLPQLILITGDHFVPQTLAWSPSDFQRLQPI
jgi:hypothetical protein